MKQQEIFQHFKTELTQVVHDLVQIRNRIFNIQNEAHKLTFLRSNGNFNSKEFGKLLLVIK